MDELASAGVGFGLGGVVVADGAGAGEVAVWVAEVAGGDGVGAELGGLVEGVGPGLDLGACLVFGPAFVCLAEVGAGAAVVLDGVGVVAVGFAPCGGFVWCWCGFGGLVCARTRTPHLSSYQGERT